MGDHPTVLEKPRIQTPPAGSISPIDRFPARSYVRAKALTSASGSSVNKPTKAPAVTTSPMTRKAPA